MNILFFLGLLGLMVGSFLNVVIFRIEKGESFVAGRSRCQHCRTELQWFENIPLLSFLVLKAKCRHCQKKLSWQYPIVEGITAITFAFVGSIMWYYSDYSYLLQAVVLLTLFTITSYGILIGVYDRRFMLIPNTFLWGINLSTLFFICLHLIFKIQPGPFFPPSILSSILGALVAGTFFFVLVFISRETWMGWGDVWLGVWGGMLLGLELVQTFITLSFTLGAVIGLTLLYTQKKTLKAEVPFGPFIILACFLLFALLYKMPSAIGFLSPWLPGII